MKNFWQTLPKPIIALAPMAGITDSAFRFLCRSLGADVVYSEMTSIDALYYGARPTLKMLECKKKEKPVVLQLFGKRPELVSRAVRLVEEAGFSGIDINFGCPARKVVSHGGGINLLKDLPLCYEIVQAVCESTKLPVSVKTRVSIGKNKEKITVFDFIKKIQHLPVSALMLHGRSYEQGFTGEVDYKVIKKAKEKFQGIVLGNGGLNSPEDVVKMLKLTSVDGVGIGRAVYGQPWIFKQIKKHLDEGKYNKLKLKEIKKVVLKHAKLNYETKGKRGIFELRKHLCWYFCGFPNASDLRKKLVLVESVEEIKKILTEI